MRVRETRAAGRRRGFSLIEVLVAMVIFSIGAASVIALIAAAAASHKRSIDHTRATLVAEGILGEVQARYGPGSEPAEIEKALAAALPAEIDGYTWDVEIFRPGDPGAARKAASALPPRFGTGGGARKPASTVRKAPAGAPRKDAKGIREGSKADAMPPSRAGPAAVPAWSDQEAIVRVTIGWSRSGQAVTESFDTIILPRPVPLETKAAKK